MYAFTTETCYPVDFEVANYYVSTHPQSFFRAGRFCTKPTPSGRITLTEELLTVRENGVTTKEPVSDGEFGRLLSRYFGLSLDGFLNERE
jgi:N-hydroxyarylamine O-acetyltransferase